LVDALAVNLEHGSLSLLLGRPDGAFANPETIATGPAPASLTVADFDGDGRADAAVADLNEHTIRVFVK
jgi:hypothetical protein